MHAEPQIVAELRSMFVRGATPSRLIRHIASHHCGDPQWPKYVETYFAEAFCVTTFFMDKYTSEVNLDEVDFSELDGELLRDMIGRRSVWQNKSERDESAWFDGLAVSADDLQMSDRIQPESQAALSDSWGSLSPQVQEWARHSMVNSQGYYERWVVLVRLVARLQEQVLELERRNQVAEA